MADTDINMNMKMNTVVATKFWRNRHRAVDISLDPVNFGPCVLRTVRPYDLISTLSDCF